MKILLTGGSGLLGAELNKLDSYIAPTRKEMDITNIEMLQSAKQKYQPDMVVHAAAYTDVKAADSSEKETALCFSINGGGTANICKVFGGVPVIYISTEYALHAVNSYSRSKLLGEAWIKQIRKYWIIRTGFKPRPFEHPRACVDMYTIGDYVDVVARLINDFIHTAPHIPSNRTYYVGTGFKSIYELARRTRPQVIKTKRNQLTIRLPELSALKGADMRW